MDILEFSLQLKESPPPTHPLHPIRLILTPPPPPYTPPPTPLGLYSPPQLTLLVLTPPSPLLIGQTLINGAYPY